MKTFVILISILSLLATDCYARGGFSGRSSFSSGRSSFSSPNRSTFSGSRSSITRSTTISRSYGSAGYYGGYGHPMMMGGFGMGYGYSNGIITGMIIGSLMHPQGTTVYTGGGYSGGNALLYPDGKVVDQNGYQVGTYLNGVFTAQQGGMVAQPAPAPVQGEPINVGYSDGDIAATILLTIVGVLMLSALLSILVWEEP